MVINTTHHIQAKMPPTMSATCVGYTVSTTKSPRRSLNQALIYCLISDTVTTVARPHKQTYFPSSIPPSSSPRILSRGFGCIKLCFDPSGGAFHKREPPSLSPLGIGPEDLGQLWLVAYFRSQPLSICQTHTLPPLDVPCISSLLLFWTGRHHGPIFGLSWLRLGVHLHF